VPPAAPLSGSAQLVERGARFSAAGKVIEAIEAYSEAIRLDPRSGDALVALGKLRVRLGEPGEAELLFTAATRIPTIAAEAYTERARLRKAQGRDAMAMDDLERAADLSPDDVARAEELSAWHVAHRAWLPALAIWRRAAASAPDAQSEHRAVVQARALAMLSGTLDCVRAGSAADRSWTRRALAKIGK
jgi:tetratricopeptide (TPR) repeat protein